MNLKDLKDFVERRFGVKHLEKEGRKTHEVYARFTYMKIAFETLGYGVSEIGRSLCRGHATVLNGLKQFDSLAQNNRDFKKYVKEYQIITSAVKMHSDKNTDFLMITATSIEQLELFYSRKLAYEVFKMHEEIDQIKGLMLDEDIFDEISHLPENDKEEFKSLAKVFLKRKKRELEYS